MGCCTGYSSDSALFRAVLTVPEHVLHQLLPPCKKTGYNLRQRSHGLMLPEAKSSFLRNNFLVRMLYTDVYWHLSVFTLLFYVLSLHLSMTFNKETWWWWSWCGCETGIRWKLRKCCGLRETNFGNSDTFMCVWLWTQSDAKTKLEPDPYVRLQLGNRQRETTAKEAATNPIWEEQFEFLCGDPTLQELSVAVSYIAPSLICF